MPKYTVQFHGFNLSDPTARLIAADWCCERGRHAEEALLREPRLRVRVCVVRGVGPVVCERPVSNETRHRVLRRVCAMAAYPRSFQCRLDRCPAAVWDRSVLETARFIDQHPPISSHSGTNSPETLARADAYAAAFAEAFAATPAARCPASIRVR